MGQQNPLDAVLFENLGDLFKRCVVIGRNERARHHLLGTATVRLEVIGCTTFGK
jgi:hypothetical protein